MTREVCYQIVSKRVLRNPVRHIFVICTDKGEKFIRSSLDLYQDKIVLNKMSPDDIYDVGFTRGVEWILDNSEAKK